MSRRHTRLHAGRWAAIRRAVFDRDSWRCRKCGNAGRLEADHVVPLDKEPGQDPYAVDGLQTLCKPCHVAKTAGENRRPDTPEETAWRRPGCRHDGKAGLAGGLLDKPARPAH